MNTGCGDQSAQVGPSHLLVVTVRAYIPAVPKKPPNPVREFHVGDRVKFNPHHGRSVDAVIKAVTADQKGRTRLQVEFGKDKTALIYDWQVCG
jgi:transcription antitermination factor NusG